MTLVMTDSYLTVHHRSLQNGSKFEEESWLISRNPLNTAEGEYH